MQIDLTDDENYLTDNEMKTILDLLQFAAKKENVETNAELSITFMDNEEIQAINHSYRNKNEPTDCISFAFEDDLTDEEIHYSKENQPPRILGDILISVEKAQEQAVEYNHSYLRELGFLAVHGFLHLLGYDHMNKEEEKIMFQRQEEILGAFGLERT